MTINEAGTVTNIENDWNNTPPTTGSYNAENPCDFTTPVNKGKTITWIGIPDSNCKEPIKIAIEYILMNNAKGKQILKSKSYSRAQADVVVGKG